METARPAEGTELDRWLIRLSHFAQFGLFVITVGSLYFTVLPLYQKAVLEEAIAKKEVELTRMNEALSRSYSRVRTASLRELHFRGTGDCLRLWRQPPLPKELGGPPPAEKSRYEAALEFDTRACLKKAASLPQVRNDLNSEDQAVLVRLVDEAAAKIDGARAEAMAAYKSASTTMTQQKADGMKMEGARAHILRLRTEAFGLSATADERVKLAISLQQEAVAIAFEDFVRTVVLSVNFPASTSAP